jgi:hypothetical protein
MAKRLQITDAMLAQIAKAAGADSMDASKIVAFEAIALNTQPISQKGGIFDKARHQRATLDLMVDYLRGNSVPVHTLHQQGDELPVGKVFTAGVFPTEAGFEVRAQFYLSAGETTIVDRLDNGVLDEVSVGMRYQKLLCSTCGWDYMGADATFMNFMERTCANDHTLGTGTTELQLVGLDKWMEMSLVSKGAASQPKVVSRARARLGREEYTRIAASGVSPDATCLFGSPTISKDQTMDLAALVAANSAQAVQLADAVRLKDAASAELTTANTQLTELRAQLAAAIKDAPANAARVTELEASAKTAKDEMDVVTTFLVEQAKLAQVASGKTGDEVVTAKNATEAMEIIKASKLALHVIPTDGKTVPAGADAGKDTNVASFASFSTKRKVAG